MYHKKKIVCFGAGPAFKGGMSDYNTALAKSLEAKDNVEVSIVSWTQQYPAIVPREFKDLVSKQDFLQGTNINCKYITNYNKPSTWKNTAEYISELKPDIVIFQWSIAIQGLPLSRIIKTIKKMHTCEIILDLHFVVQKEQSSLDKFFSKLCLKLADTYIVHALKTYEELKSLLPNLSYELTFDGERKDRSDVKHVIKLFHPIYDLYKVDKNFDVLAFKNKYKLQKNVFLFFGFIRKYKGLHNVIAAFNALSKKRNDVSLLICGESFWNTLEPNNFRTKFKKFLFGSLKKLLLKKADDESDYNPLAMIEELGLRDRVVVFNEFIPNEDVHKYFQVSNAVVLYYLTATPSGIESLSYNFNLPILATKVGHFPETISEGINGFLAEENIESMTAIMEKFLDNPIPWENVDRYKEKLSWSSYADAILA